MATPVLLINKDTGEKRTKMYEAAELENLIRCDLNGLCGRIQLLPEDEGLNQEQCYKIYVEVTG